MKKIISLLFALILIFSTCLSLTACSDDKDTEGAPTGMQVADRTDRYVFFVPENWIVQEKIDGIALAYAPNSDRSSLSLYSAEIEDGIGVEDYWVSFADQYEQYTEFKLLSEPKKVKFGTNDARLYEMSFTANGVGYQSFQCFCIKDGYVYIMTYLAKSAQKTDEATYYSDNFNQADYSRECFTLNGSTGAQGAQRTPFADEGTPEGMMLISDVSTVDYKLFVPTSWVIDMQSGYTSAYKSEGKASVGVSYTIPSARTLDEYVSNLENQYKVIYSQFSGMVKGEDIMLGGVQSAVYTYTATYAGREIKCKQVFAIVGSYVYTLTYTAGAQDYDLSLAEVDKIISEFKFI